MWKEEGQQLRDYAMLSEEVQGFLIILGCLHASSSPANSWLKGARPYVQTQLPRAALPGLRGDGMGWADGASGRRFLLKEAQRRLASLRVP